MISTPLLADQSNIPTPASYSSLENLMDKLKFPESSYFFSNHEGHYPGALNPPSNCAMKSDRGHLRWLLSQAGVMALPSHLEIDSFRERSQKLGYHVDEPILVEAQESIETQFRQAEQAGVKSMQVFAPTYDLWRAHEKSRVKFPIDSLTPDFIAAVDTFGDKVQLVKMLNQNGLAVGFPQILFAYSKGSLNLLGDTSLADIENYSRAVVDHAGGERALFVQRANASGGRGNYLVRFKDQLNCYEWPDGHQSKDAQEVLNRAIDIAKNAKDSIRIAPFLNIIDTFSVGVRHWGKNDYALFGTRQQVLDSEKTFIGFNYRNGIDPLTKSHTDKFLKLVSHTYPEFKGSFGIDFATFVNPFTFKMEIFIAEVNMRLDGTMPLSQLVLRYHAKEWIKGELHIAQLDSVETNISDSNQLFNHLSTDLPLYSPSKPYGIVIMTPPLRAANKKTYVCIGVVSNSQEESEALLKRASLRLKSSILAGRPLG